MSRFFTKINNESEIRLGSNWVDSTKFNARNSVVNEKGQEVASDYNGRQYRLIRKERNLPLPEKIGRGLLGLVIVIVTLGVALLLRVQTLFKKPYKFFGIQITNENSKQTPTSSPPQTIQPNDPKPQILNFPSPAQPVTGYHEEGTKTTSSPPPPPVEEPAPPKENTDLLQTVRDIFQCAICFEPMKTAVSFNPCGHELDETCALGVLNMAKKSCPICRVDVDSFRPAFVTRQVVERLFPAPPTIPTPSSTNVVVHVQCLIGRSFTLHADRSSKVAKLLPLIHQHQRSYLPDMISLMCAGKRVSPFNSLHEYVSKEQSEITFHATLGIFYSMDLIDEFSFISKLVRDRLGDNYLEIIGDNRMVRNIYRAALNQAINA